LPIIAKNLISREFWFKKELPGVHSTLNGAELWAV
jgi:hypothetical protein